MRAASATLLACFTLSFAAACGAQADPAAYSWPPPTTQPTLPLWPGTPPDAARISPPAGFATSGPEVDISKPNEGGAAGRPVLRLSPVTTPTLTLYQSATPHPGNTAIVVFPGGGYNILAADLEGTEVCRWLNGAGAACVLVRYRVPGSGPYPKSPAALEDAQRAVGLVRSHAAEWQIDPARIGVLGFSAGGHLVAALSAHTDKRLYSQVDAADRLSCRPDFAVLIYPAYLTAPERGYAIQPEVAPPSTAPPTFLLQTEDDPIHVENAATYYLELKRAGVPAELHLYSTGGHGYGLRPTQLPVTHWPPLVETWMRDIHMLPPAQP